ncbi:MAG: ubiquitin-like domain-containing protein [Anaerolineae bacterium]
MSSETAVIEPHLRQPVHALRRQIQPGLLALIALLAAAGLMVLGYRWTGQPIALTIDGQTTHVRTHQTTVGGLLDDRGIVLRPEDIVQPALDTPLEETAAISIQRARAVTLIADGTRRTQYTHAASPAAVLLDAGIGLRPFDRVSVNNQTWVPETPFVNNHPVEVRVHRAVPFSLSDNGLRAQLWTTAPTLGQALTEKGIPVYVADAVSLPLDTPMSAGLTVTIRRSQPVSILVDGREIRTRTRAETVAGILTQEGITLGELDYTKPGVDAPLAGDQTIDVRRVTEEFVYEEAPIPFETVWQADPTLELDAHRLIQAGDPGVRRRRTRIVYENGEEVSRDTANWWVEEDPTPEIIAYGTDIKWRTVDTPDGPKRYWRKMRVLATSYSAATSGKSRDHPAYGITRLGWEARRGIVAVDPRVINLRQKLYVPGYGTAVAGDTGSKIRGRHIDLGFDEDNLQLWYRWVDVYLLEPAPPPKRIPYVLPDWPLER